MNHVRHIAGAAMVAALVCLFSPGRAQAEEHLDRFETRRVVRRLEERSDVLLDRIDAWVSERHEEREHRAEELLRASDRFEELLTQFKIDLRSHEEPWELRDRAQEVVHAAADMGRIIEHADYHDELRREWEDVRDRTNELAHHFRLEEIGH